MNTTSKFLLGLFASAALLATACDSGAKKATDDQKVEKADAAPADAAKEEPAKAEEAKEDAPADAPAGDEPEAAAGGDKIGIPECDEYFEKYLKCIDDKMPEAAKETTKKALQDSVAAWKAAAEGPGKDTLAQTCKTALDTAKKATEAMGCEW